jgi:hypothetical protein
VRAQEKTVTIMCPIVRTFIEHNPEYAGLIDPKHPGVTKGSHRSPSVFRAAPHSPWTRVLGARCHLRAEDDRSAGAPFLALFRRPLWLCRAGTGAARSASHAERAGVEPHPSWAWHRAGVQPSQSRAAIAAGRVAASVDRLACLDAGDERVGAGLLSVPGVGVWTVAETTQRSHGDPDSVSVGDYNLAKEVGWALIGSPVDDDGMLELLEPWRGHRQWIVRLIGASGFANPDSVLASRSRTTAPTGDPAAELPEHRQAPRSNRDWCSHQPFVQQPRSRTRSPLF